MSHIALYVCPVLFHILTVALADRAAWLWWSALAHSWISHQNALVVCIMCPHSLRKCIISFSIQLWHPDSLQSLWRLTLKPFLQYSYSTVRWLSFLLLFLMDNPPSLFSVRETCSCTNLWHHYRPLCTLSFHDGKEYSTLSLFTNGWTDRRYQRLSFYEAHNDSYIAMVLTFQSQGCCKFLMNS